MSDSEHTSGETADYTSVSPFARQFEGDAETPGKLVDILLRKHYQSLTVEEISKLLPGVSNQEIHSLLNVFESQGIVSQDERGYTVNKDDSLAQRLRADQTRMLLNDE